MNPHRPRQLTLETFDTSITVRQRDNRLKCPKCKAQFETVRVGALTVERCTGCHGIWFDLLEWDNTKQLEGAERLDDGDSRVGAAHDEDADLHCPKCRTTPLTRLEVPHHVGLRIDKCPRCYGAFFDAGEFLEYRELTLTERLKKFWHVK